MPKNLQAISSFLTERKIRIKPDEANSSGLARIEKIDFSGTIHLAEGKDTKTDMILIKKGDLVISGINVAKGALAVYEGDDDVMATIHYSAYIFDVEKIDIEFLKWFLKSPAFVDALIDQTGGGIKTEIKAKKFLLLKIPLPNFEEQKQIELKLNSFQERHLNAVRELEKQAKLMTKLRASILSDAVSGRLVPQDPNDESANILLEKIRSEKEHLIKEGKIKREKPLPPITEDEIPYELPEGWVWCRLSTIAEIGTGATPLKSTSGYYNGTIPWVTSSATGDRFIRRAEVFITEKALRETNCKIYPTGTLILAMYGQGKTRGQISELCIDATINQACASIRLFLFDKTTNEYIKLFFEKHYVELRELAAGGAQPNLNLQKIKDTLIPLPPFIEQQRIISKVNQLMHTCDALEAEVAKSRTETDRLMQTILKEAFAEQPANQSEPSAPKTFQRSVLAAYLIDNSQDDPYFGHVKLQKMLFMCEAVNNLDFETEYKRHAMGPYDPKLIRSVDTQLKKSKWFEVKKIEGEISRYVYHPLEKVEEYKKYIGRYWDHSKIEHIFNLMRKMTTLQAEIVATLYSANADLKKTNEIVLDEVLINEARNNWHDNKKNIPIEKWQTAIKWLKNKGLL